MANARPNYVLSDEGRRVLAEREGLKTTAYRDSQGILTIGLGHTSAAGPPKVVAGMTISEAEAWTIFERDIERFRAEIRPHISPKVALKPHQFDALASLIYNIGASAFIRSTVLKKVNAGDMAGAAEAILMWNKPPEIIPRRRGEYWQFKEALYLARATAEGRALG